MSKQYTPLLSLATSRVRKGRAGLPKRNGWLGVCPSNGRDRFKGYDGKPKTLSEFGVRHCIRIAAQTAFLPSGSAVTFRKGTSGKFAQGRPFPFRKRSLWRRISFGRVLAPISPKSPFVIGRQPVHSRGSALE